MTMKELYKKEGYHDGFRHIVLFFIKLFQFQKKCDQ